ncbi:MoaD/ThiS family protein [Longimicrobium sp.]|uniref:MoaD/ThiS family protein n=1 Tax=Longimicrobium sp. TaxID=2029185 RepID=UPI002C84509F|nr:MoaD/ThiS family protein [Longimicrobium sp.]HSU17056.1 MoaD/ThiS family protein [Longimicrobium sp.]
MPVMLQLPQSLAVLVGTPSLEASGGTVGEVIADVSERYPALGQRLRDPAGRPYSHVRFFLNDDDVRERGGLAAPVRGGDELVVVPAVAGG